MKHTKIETSNLEETSKKIPLDLIQHFGWFISLPNDLWTLLNLTLLGHLFKKEKEKETLSLQLIRAFLWLLWNEKNAQIFKDIHKDFESFKSSVIYTSLTYIM